MTTDTDVEPEVQANTFTLLIDTAMVLPVPAPEAFVRGLFPTVSVGAVPIDYNKPRPPRPKPVVAPTPLRDFLTARHAELEAALGGTAAAAFRAVLDLHQPRGFVSGEDYFRVNACYACGFSGYMDDSVAAHTDACASLRALAEPFAGHPDLPELQESWQYDEWDCRD